MKEEAEKQKIRALIATWLEATKAGDVDRVLSLMSDDAIFLQPGQPPMHGRNAFAAGLRAALQQVRIEGESEPQEIRILRDHAFCWCKLSITITPLRGGTAQHRSGHTLSILQKSANGDWLLIRDANLLAAN